MRSGEIVGDNATIVCSLIIQKYLGLQHDDQNNLGFYIQYIGQKYPQTHEPEISIDVAHSMHAVSGIRVKVNNRYTMKEVPNNDDIAQNVPKAGHGSATLEEH